MAPGKTPKPYVYQRGFDDSFLLVIDPLTNTSTAIETLTDVGVDSPASTGTAVESFTDLGLDALLTTGAATESLGELATDSGTSTTTSSANTADAGLDSFTTTSTAAESVADLIAVIDALTSASVAIQSFLDSGLESATSSTSAVEALSELLTDSLAQVSVSLASLLEAAQEGIQSLTTASQGVGETGSDLLSLLTSMVSTASFTEVEADVFLNLAISSGSLSEQAVESLVHLAISIQVLNDLAAEALTSIAGAQEAIVDSGFIPPAGIDDDLTSIAVYVSTLDDKIISAALVDDWFPGFRITQGVERKKSRDQIAVLEKQAEVIVSSEELPQSYPVGAKKAYQAFQDFYGSEEGRRIFIQKALEQGRGDSVHAKIADVFKKGAHPDQTKKMDTQVEVLGKHGPNVSVTPLRGQGVTILRRG